MLIPHLKEVNMQTRITELHDYSDDRGNVVRCLGDNEVKGNFSIIFRGSGNTVTLNKNAVLRELNIHFEADNSYIELGRARPGTSRQLSLLMRIGHECLIRIGNDCTCETRVFMSAAEGSQILVGDDVMWASSCEVRATDSHAIYELNTGARLNYSQDVVIGSHVWLGGEVVVLGGVSIGDNTVLGYRSLVTEPIPSNVIAGGVPARVIRKNIRWERQTTYNLKPIPSGI